MKRQPKAETALQTYPVGIIEAIYKRRAVRDFTPEMVSDVAIHTLLYAAIQAPTAMHKEPWAFAVIQDKKLLNRLSESAEILSLHEVAKTDNHRAKHSLEMLANPDFNIFYNATTLIVIYGNSDSSFASADCWLSAENMMLAAYAAGIASCVIGFSVAALNTPEWKKELDIPLEMVAYAPILLGHPAGETPATSRKPPEILCWKKAAA